MTALPKASSSAFEVVAFETAHLEAASRLSGEAGWPHRPDDWEMALHLGKGAALMGPEGLAGTVLWWRFGTLTTIGLVIVSSQYQGQGLGRRLMTEALEAMGDGTLALNATDQALSLYHSLGFRETGKTVQQCQGMCGPVGESDASGIVTGSGADLTEVFSLDRAACGLDRRRLLQAIAARGHLLLARSSDAASATGYAFCRPFGRGWHIGPVIAPDLETAQKLIAAHLAAHPDAFVRVDLADTPALVPWLEGQGLKHVGGATSMVRGDPPRLGTDTRLFGIASQAFG